MTPEERMAKETTEKSYAMFEQKFNEQQERMGKQTQIDRDSQITGAMNLDARVENKVAGYDAAKSLDQAASLATIQTQIQAAGNNLEERDKAQRNLAFVKSQYESDLIQSGGQVKTAEQEASKSLTSAVAKDSIAEARSGVGRSFVSGLVKGAAQNSGTSYDTNAGYYYDKDGNALTQEQYDAAVYHKDGKGVYQQEQSRMFGFNTGTKYSAVNPLAAIPRIQNPTETTETGETTSSNQSTIYRNPPG
jgi:hypothetical protein